MENHFTIIDKLAKQSLPAIVKHASKIGLFAGSIKLNTKAERYHLFASPGDVTPIAYERKETMEAFVCHLCRIISTGQDLQKQPTMRASEVLKGCKVLVYSNTDLTLPNNSTRLTLPADIGTYATACLIGEKAQEFEAKIVIIDDATRLLGTWPREAIVKLNCIADVKGLLLLFGFNVKEATDKALNYIACHAHNLCQLTEGSFELAQGEAEPKMINYFSFVYGRPTPHKIVYTIDESGGVTIPPTPTTDLLRMEECAKEMAAKPITQAKFVDRAFGYFQGEFQPSSFYGMISASMAQGTLHKSGKDNKVTICFAGATPSRNPYNGCVALTALTDARNKATQYTARRKAVAKFGEFKLLAIDSDIPANMAKNFMAYLTKAIVTKGKAFGGCIEINSPHHNLLVIVVGRKELADKLQQYIGKPNEADLEIVSTNGEITDGDLLHIYRAGANKMPRDFVSIIGLNNIKQTDYTPIQFAKELAITAKQRGMLTIAQTGVLTEDDLAQLKSDMVWFVRPLVCYEERNEMETNHNITIPSFYLFEATANNFDFRGKFDDRGNKPNSEAFKKAMLTSLFYCCNQTPANEVYAATDTNIRQARKYGLIRIEFTSNKKRIKDSLITFIG